MGTGVAPVLYSPKKKVTYGKLRDYSLRHVSNFKRKNNGQASRPISTGQLNPLLDLHTQPINLVVYQGSSDQVSLPDGDI